MGVVSIVQADEPSSEAGSAHSSSGDVGIVEHLLSDLDSADWRTRESATQALMDYGPEIYEALRDGFLTHNIGYEARRRIERIAREIHLTESLGPGPAFLGISLARGRITYMADARVPADATALLIEHVFLGTAADRGGLRPGDLVLTLNGNRATGTSEASRFTTWIGRQPPGTPCLLGVFRGGKGIYLNKTEHPEFDYRAFSRIKTRVISSEEDSRLPKGTEGILLIDVTGADPRLKLKDGDLLVALDDQPLKAGEASNRFSRWVEGGDRTDNGSAVERNPMQIMGPAKPGQGNPPWWQPNPGGKRPTLPSAQMLRGGKLLELEVILGRSPSYLPDRRMMLQRIDASRVETAEAEFDAWWRDWFTAENVSSDPFDSSRAWDLNP
ncbi:MAG: hypothetical protein ACE5EQ_09985 [Phycisphaerae bacterium]